MKKTINEVINDFNKQALEIELKKLHEVGTPRLIIETLKNTKEFPEVKGIKKKYPVGNKEVTQVYEGTGQVKNYALPFHGEPVSTTILFILTEDNEEYYYDYFNNKIENSLDNLNLVEVPTDWKVWLTIEEQQEPSNFWKVEYVFNVRVYLKEIVFATSKDEAKRQVEEKYSKNIAFVHNVQNLTKKEAINTGLAI